ncbi:MAG TPA: hypothetical protein VGR16_09425 [Thermomicrobiales bacterium]|nr:hypothetical protein [Thermomicrobiales bacterium]
MAPFDRHGSLRGSRLQGQARLNHALAGLLVLLVALLTPLGATAQEALPDPPFTSDQVPLPPPPSTEPVYPPPAPTAVLPAPPAGPGGPFSLARSEHFAFFVQPNPRMSGQAVAEAFGPKLETAYAELSALFAVKPAMTIDVYVYAADDGFIQASRGLEASMIAPLGVMPDPAARLHIALPRLDGRSPLEVENALRHGTARVLLGIASGGNLPRGLAEGMAMYTERPVTPRLARIAALTAGAYQGGTLLSWSDLNRRWPVDANPELITSESYAMVAFLIDRYGFRSFRGMLNELRANPDWRLAMRFAYNRSANEIEAQWRDNLPRWTASEWRDNLVAAFDLEPARTTLTAGDYAGAKRHLEHSWRLFTDLDDQPRLAETESLLSQAEVGIQAETAMTQAQQALELHTYDRARALLTQARAQYDQLPAGHRPESLLETYEELTNSGLVAIASLEEANQLKSRWTDYPRARAAALDAGTRFAALGDDEMRGEAAGILEDLDDRQRRLVLLLSALAAITAAWLVLWLWTRGPTAFDWR